MMVLVVRWILKENRYTSDILLASGLILMENIALGVLSYHTKNSGKFIHLNSLLSMKYLIN